MTYKILIVDDELPNLRLLERLFRRDYYCLTASSGPEAIKLLEQHDVAIIITDQRMPQMTGIELLKETSDIRPHMVRILLTGYTDVEALVEALNCGLVYMYVTKPWKNDDLKLRVNRAIEHYENNKKRNSLAIANERLISRLKEMKVGFIRSLAHMLKSKDEYLSNHGARVSRHASLLGQTLGLSEELGAELRVAALLQDIGIIGPDPLSSLSGEAMDERDVRVLQQRSERGARILAAVPEFSDIADTVRFRQENFDGSGFPRGLVGEQIPLTSRILRITDDYHRLLNARNGQPFVGKEEAVNILIQSSGAELDPQLLQTFVQLISEEESDTENLCGQSQAFKFPAYTLN